MSVSFPHKSFYSRLLSRGLVSVVLLMMHNENGEHPDRPKFVCVSSHSETFSKTLLIGETLFEILNGYLNLLNPVWSCLAIEKLICSPKKKRTSFCCAGFRKVMSILGLKKIPLMYSGNNSQFHDIYTESKSFLAFKLYSVMSKYPKHELYSGRIFIVPWINNIKFLNVCIQPKHDLGPYQTSHLNEF